MEEPKIHFLLSWRVHVRPLTRRLFFPLEPAVVVLRQGPLASVVYPRDNLPPRVAKGDPVSARSGRRLMLEGGDRRVFIRSCY